jgi:hypothetical protein
MSKMKKANHPQRTRISHACALLLFVIVLSLGACQWRCARNTSTPTLPAWSVVLRPPLSQSVLNAACALHVSIHS